MWTSVNRVLRNRLPALHRRLRSMLIACPIPIPKAICRRWFFAHPASIQSNAECHVMSWVEEIVQRGDTFLDVGANVGWISLVAARCVGRKGRVVAFEPSPPLVSRLRFHRQANFAHNLTVEAAAISETSETTVLYLHNSGDSDFNSIFEAAVIYEGKEKGRPGAVEVQGWSIDEYCEKAGLRPHAIKIDVEGAELMVVRGAQGVMKRYKPALILAVHPPLIPEKKADALFSLLDQHGYKICRSETIEYDGSLWGDYLLR